MQFLCNRDDTSSTMVQQESLSGTLLTNTMGRAIARRQSCPSKKSSTIGTPCKSRNLSTADIYRPLVRDLSKDFGSHC
ncbi:hypothetical protein Y032_0085g1847 [Ancylostoma ceylanicum]|nr:hypothetical protein Y032_0085g1847 [Ancylostoma ceylanicum]